MTRVRHVVCVGLVAAVIAGGIGTAAIPALAVDADAFAASAVLDLHFDGDLADASASAQPVASETQTPASFEAGVSGQALSMNGSQALSLGSSTTLQPANLTFSFWWKPSGTMGGEQVFAWNKGVYNSDGWYLSSESDGTPLALSVGPGVGDTQPYKVAVQSPRATFFPADSWTHVVVVYDQATKAVTFYRNGERQISTVVVPVGGGATGVLGTTGDTKTVGFNGTVYRGAFLRGALDDYAIYTAPASDADVVDLYRANVPDFDPATVAQKALDALSLPASAATDFSLPAVAANGSALTWSSSTPTVIAVSGTTATVSRPNGADATVVLTATASYAGSAPRTKTYSVTVPQDGASTSIYVDEAGLSQVQLDDPYLLNSGQKMVDYLLSLDPQRFLYSFNIEAGLPTGDAQPYGGWERTTGARFQGHFFGHYISALSQAYASEKDSDTQQRLLDKLTTAVEGLKTVQSAYAAKDPANAGYVAPFPVSYLPGGADGLIVPFYNLHKVLAGLLDAHAYAPKALGDDALSVASDFGTWLRDWASRQADPAAMLSTEYGGMNEALYNLYSITENPAHKRAAEYFDELSLFRQLAAGNDVLAGKHANTTIPKVIGALKRYTLFTDNPRLYAALTDAEKADLDMYRRAAENFWTMVTKDHSYVNGGNSYSEHFHDPGTLSEFATNGVTGGYGENSTVEGCNEYNMLKLTRALFRVDPRSTYADYYELTYINTILASQNPETGMVTYFQPMTAGYAKVFGKPEDEFWCDQGTATESFTKLGDSIYFRKGGTIYVNMFHSSVFTEPERNLRLTQTADVPSSDTVTFAVSALDGGAVADGTNLRLRVPGWLKTTPKLTVNGASVDAAASTDGYIEVPAVAGDTITYTIAASVTVNDQTENKNWVAFQYGPIVLATELNRTNVDADYEAGILVRMSVADKSVNNNILVSDVAAFKADIVENLVRLPDGVNANGMTTMRFGLKNTDAVSGALVFQPWYSLYNARYALYMNLIEPDSAEAQALIKGEKEKLRVQETTIDSLTSFDANNSEAGKNYKFNKSAVGVWRGQPYRDGQNTADAWFQYDMKVDPAAAHNYLGVRYYGGDAGRTFDVYLNDTKLKTERVTDVNGADQWYIQYDEIPTSVLTGIDARDSYQRNQNGEYVLDAQGRKIPVVTVRFQGTGASFVGGVYGVYTATTTGYDSNAELSGLSVDGGTLEPALSDGVYSYAATVPREATSATLSLSPAVASGLVYVNDVLIDDTAPRTVALVDGGAATVVRVRAYAQDHATYRDYTVQVSRAVTGTPTPEPTPTPTVTPTPTSTPSPTGSPEPTASPEPTQTSTPTPMPTWTGGPTSAPRPPVVASASASTVERGGTVRVSVSGLRPGDQVSAELHSDPIRITGIPVADASGRTVFDVVIPASLEVGAHTIVVRHPSGVLIAEIPVTVLPEGQLAVTGAQAPWAFALLAATLLLAGVTLKTRRPPRRRAVG